MLFNELNDVLIHILGFVSYLIIEVRAVERAFEFCSIAHAEILLDISTHFVCCRSGKCDDGCLTNLVDDGSYATVFGSEVVTPFGDTVGFVYCIERNLCLFEKVDIILFGQRFRCHIEQFSLSGTNVGLHLVYRCFVER